MVLASIHSVGSLLGPMRVSISQYSLFRIETIISKNWQLVKLQKLKDKY